MRKPSRRCSPSTSTLVLLRNNFNGGVTVFSVSPLFRQAVIKGTYQQFYGRPYQED